MSTRPDFDQIKTALGHLSRRQLEDIRARTTLLLRGPTSDEKGKAVDPEHEDWLLHGVLAELARRGVLQKEAGMFRIRSHKSFASFSMRSTEVRTLLEAAVSDITVNERRLLGEIAARELARYITWKDISLTVMLENISTVPQALDRAFPGYLEAGMLDMLIRQESVR